MHPHRIKRTMDSRWVLCVCVSVRERGREKERESGREGEKAISNDGASMVLSLLWERSLVLSLSLLTTKLPIALSFSLSLLHWYNSMERRPYLIPPSLSLSFSVSSCSFSVLSLRLTWLIGPASKRWWAFSSTGYFRQLRFSVFGFSVRLLEGVARPKIVRRENIKNSGNPIVNKFYGTVINPA